MLTQSVHPHPSVAKRATSFQLADTSKRVVHISTPLMRYTPYKRINVACRPVYNAHYAAISHTGRDTNGFENRGDDNTASCASRGIPTRMLKRNCFEDATSARVEDDALPAPRLHLHPCPDLGGYADACYRCTGSGFNFQGMRVLRSVRPDFEVHEVHVRAWICRGPT